MRSPKVSVCIDVCNYEAFLPEAIESVLNQDFGDFEVLVIDDCSIDSSYEIAKNYAAKDKRVIARQNSINMGMVKNRNASLAPARGEYVKILHADDFLCSNDALGKMATVLDHNPGMSLVACAMQIVSDTIPRPVRRSYFEDDRPLAGTTVITRCLRERKNLIGPPSATMFRRDRGLRGFDESFFNSADWEMWFHLLEQGCFGFLPQPLVAYRRHARQQTEKDKLTLTESTDLLALLDRYLDRPYVRISRFSKNAFRHRAMANFAKRSRRLDLSEGRALINRNGKFRFYAGYPAFLVADLFSRLRRSVDRFLQRRKHRGVPQGEFPPGLNVAGFLKGEYGIGDSSRAYCKSIRESNLPAVFINIHSRNHRNLDPSFDHDSKTNPYSVNLMTFSFDYARRFSRDMGRRFFKDRYNIGLWYWELEKFPTRWHPCFEYYDEIWTATDFCQKSLVEVSPIPVVRVGYPFFPEEPPSPDRAGFGFPEEAFLFLFNFDFHSVVERKNPAGLITAFKQAFPTGTENVLLIMKSINSRHHPEQAAELASMSEGRNVIWINEHLDGSKMNQLFATADCYVSLHRSEGLGLGMARAMSYGKPVIATGYSGNMDFTTSENSLLVRYRLAELDRDYGVYNRGNFWAEPDTDHAASQMRWVYDNPSEARLMGQRARSHIQEVMNPAIVLNRLCQRLGTIDVRYKSL